MHRHPLDLTALVAGTLFVLSGLAVLARERWDSVDVAALTHAAPSQPPERCSSPR
ncbi:MAG: hypothetical protein R2695_15250 [Acidimicrobiales bacterium]